MRHLLLPLVLSMPAVALAEPAIDVIGTCPGVVAIQMSHGTPEGQVAIYSARGPRTNYPTTLTSGPCAGVDMGLSSDMKLRKTKTMLSNGKAVVVPDLPEQLCGQWIQSIDLETCEVGNVAKLAENERIFVATGGKQTFVVPEGTTYDIAAYGAKGGDGETAGGRGAVGRGEVYIHAGYPLEIHVGVAGVSGFPPLQGGYNGGGDVLCCGGWSASGGGASDVRLGPHPDTRIIAAPGGGGGGSLAYGGYGGDGGVWGAHGQTTNSLVAPAGRGATTDLPGAGGLTPSLDGDDLGNGGDCQPQVSAGCGAGGGGHKGGGGGFGSGGGGGSSWYAHPDMHLTNTVHEGEWNGDGKVIIRW